MWKLLLRISTVFKQRLIGRRSHSPTSWFPSSPTPVVITEPFPDRTGSLRHMSKDMGSDKTMKCVSAATSRQCYISSIPVWWPNSKVVYNVYTLQTKLLLIGWRYMAHRSIRNITLHVYTSGVARLEWSSVRVFQKGPSSPHHTGFVSPQRWAHVHYTPCTLYCYAMFF